MGSAVLGALASAALKQVPSPGEIYGMRHQIVASLTIVAIVAGALMYALCARAKLQAIGRMLLLAAIVALLIAIAPSTVQILHSP